MALLGTAMSVQAAPAVTKQSCLAATAARHFDTAAVVANLGLTPDQVRATRARLSQYTTASGVPNLDGLGLTPAQITEIKRRMAAYTATHTHPLGWPCAPFKNRARVVKFVKSTLIYNGFRPSVQFYGTAPRQIAFKGIQDGQEYFGTVAKYGLRKITILLTCARPCSGGGSASFNLPFDA
jgi:hypothetical protein